MGDSPMKLRFADYLLAFPIILAGVLAVALAPAPAFAGQQELAAGGASEAASTQGEVQLLPQASKKALAKKTKTMRAKYRAVLKNARLGKGSFNKAYRDAGGYAYWRAVGNMRAGRCLSLAGDVASRLGGFAVNARQRDGQPVE